MINKKIGKEMCDIRHVVITMEDLISIVTESTKYFPMATSDQFTTFSKDPKGNKSTVLSNIFVGKSRNVTSFDLHVSSEETRLVNVDQTIDNVDGIAMKSITIVDHVVPIKVVNHVNQDVDHAKLSNVLIIVATETIVDNIDQLSPLLLKILFLPKLLC